MKVLFLDIDGVCNCAKTFQNNDKTHFPIDKYMAFLVGKIQLETDCSVVLSSSWRYHKESIEEINKRIVPIIGITPLNSYGGVRGKEIQAWLNEHPEVTKYAILDDDSDMLPDQIPNFFKTTWQDGITEEIAAQVIKHLNT